MRMKMIIWLLFVAVAIYSMLDAIQTKMLLDLGATEVNPICCWLIETTGTVYSIFWAKSASLIFLMVLLILHLSTIKEGLRNEK